MKKRSQLLDGDSAAPLDGERSFVAREFTPPAVASWRPSMALCPVERYGRFEVLGRIGRGGMAEILLARERPISGGTRHLVIKRILPEIADDDEMLRMFLDEARVVMGLSHPNLCQIYDVGEHEGTWYIAMEWVNGSTLNHLIRRAVSTRRVDAAIMARVIGQCAEALHHAHTARDAEGRLTGLVHRDVSPHNIMVAYDGRVKLLDFGIAKTNCSTHRTEAGVVKGKVCYMAPEQWLSDPLDGRTDVFALGACLVEALSGEVMFRRDTQMEVMRAILNVNSPSPAEFCPEAPRALVEIAERALAKRPQDRFQTALEMSSAIERFLASLPEPCGASRVASYARELLSSEVEFGPVLERAVHGAHAAAPLYLPPVPPGLLGIARPTPITQLPVPPPFQGRLPATLRASERTEGAFASDVVAYGAGRETRAVARLSPVDGFRCVETVVDARSPFDDAPTRQRPTLPSTLPREALRPAPLTLSEPPQSQERRSFDRVPRPLARTLSMPVVRSIGRITFAVVPAAAAMLLIGYWVFVGSAGRLASPATNPAALQRPATTERAAEPAAEAVRAPIAATPKPNVVSLSPENVPAVENLGLLTIKTNPWSTVYLGDRMLGTTPLVRVVVPSGDLTLKFVDRDGRPHTRRIASSERPLRDVFFDFEAASRPPPHAVRLRR